MKSGAGAFGEATVGGVAYAFLTGLGGVRKQSAIIDDGDGKFEIMIVVAAITVDIFQICFLLKARPGGLLMIFNFKIIGLNMIGSRG